MDPGPVSGPAEAAPDLDRVFEEIAALEAQYQHAARRPDPAVDPTTPLDHSALTLADPTLAADPAPRADAASAATERHGPVFDFTLPMPEQEASDPFTPPPGRRTRSKRRYLMWTACALTAALLVQGGWWLYKERSDDGSLALVATMVKDAPRPEPATQQQAPAEPAATPAAPAPPPMVMLEADPPAAAGAQQPEQAVARESLETEFAAQQAAPAPPPQPATGAARLKPEATRAPATAPLAREPARRAARTSAMQAQVSSEEGSMAALLRACRAHGYHATQCIKQGCSVTRYGFACRGR